MTAGAQDARGPLDRVRAAPARPLRGAISRRLGSGSVAGGFRRGRYSGRGGAAKRIDQPSPARRSRGVATAELLTLNVTLPAR